MTTTTAAASPLSEARSTVIGAHQLAADPHQVLIHDIRTPLAAISAYAQLLLRRTTAAQSDVPGLAEGLRAIEQAALRVGNLLDEFKVLPSLYAAEGTDYNRERVDLVDLAKRIADESHAAALSRTRVVLLSAVPDLVGWWDRGRLERMLANLIDNALKYNRHDRPVMVSIQREDGWAVLSVADQGVGIPAAEQRRVFERGYRATNVTRHFSGSGLGLAGAHQIVAEHGGTITLESQIGMGTTVTVRVPLEVPTS
jgi:signal transduction histidine kinase